MFFCKFCEIFKNNFSYRTPPDNCFCITDDKEQVKVFTNFFSNIIQNLNAPRKNRRDSNFDDIRDPTLKTIIKYHKHPSILVLAHNIAWCTWLLFNAYLLIELFTLSHLHILWASYPWVIIIITTAKYLQNNLFIYIIY